MTRRIGNTTYKVKVLLSDNATESFEDKMLRLVRNDSAVNYKSEETDDKTKED